MDVPVNVCDIANSQGVILEEDRSVVIIGPVGSGKTTFVGCLTEDYSRQRIGLDSQTLKARRVKFTKYYRRPSGTYYGINFTVYDTYGFIGDPFQDIFSLHRLINEISDAFPAVHAVIFCATAVRLHKSGESILSLISHLGGDALKSRLKFLVTNAPSRLVLDNNFLPATKARLERVTGFAIPEENILTSDLIDPNQFSDDDPLKKATIDSWQRYQSKFYSWLKDISEEPIRVNRISLLSVLYAFFYVFWWLILLGLAISLCVALYCKIAADNHAYQVLLAKYNQSQERTKQGILQTVMDGARVTGLELLKGVRCLKFW